LLFFEDFVKRHFLFLQGVSSPFFKQLAKLLRAAGHRVTKISFNMGDVAYWATDQSIWFRQSESDLAGYLEEIYQREGITDQVLFGDRRPVHRDALQIARKQGVRNHVFEEGYFRPYLVTLEREGVNSRSQLPRDVTWLRAAGHTLLASSVRQVELSTFQSPFWRRAAHDVAYHLAASLNPLVFPRYRTHASVLAPIEYAGFVARKIKNKFRAKEERISMHDLLTCSEDFYFLPLQLDTDFQVRDQPELNTMRAVLERVIASFAQHAPANTRLAIKNHPLAFDQVNYQLLSTELASQCGVSERIVYFETGNLEILLENALGTITLNSTVGNVALERGCPTLCLAPAVYDFQGLTAQCGLDAFWRQLPKPEPELFRLFKTVVTHTTQVNGGFYCPRGIELAAIASAKILVAEQSPLERLRQQISL
jgi:capsular polysaccharide export protein